MMIVVTLIIFGMLTLGLAGGVKAANLEVRGCYGIAGAALMIALLTFPNELKKFKPTNWLLRLGGERLLVKYRSSYNSHFDENDPQIVALTIGEIASLCEAQGTMQDLRGRTYKVSYLELRLASSVGTSELEEALRTERNRPAPKVGIYSSKALDYPVSVPQPGVVRIQWSGISPELRDALAFLSMRLPLDQPACERNDARDITSLADDEKKAAIRKLAISGNVVAAIKTARRDFGLSTTQAKQYVDGLVGMKSDVDRVSPD